MPDVRMTSGATQRIAHIVRFGFRGAPDGFWVAGFGCRTLKGGLLATGRRREIVGCARFLVNLRVTVDALIDGWGRAGRRLRKAARVCNF